MIYTGISPSWIIGGIIAALFGGTAAIQTIRLSSAQADLTKAESRAQTAERQLAESIAARTSAENAFAATLEATAEYRNALQQCAERHSQFIAESAARRQTAAEIIANHNPAVSVSVQIREIERTLTQPVTTTITIAPAECIRADNILRSVIY